MNKNKQQLQQLIAYNGSMHLDMYGAMAARQEQLIRQQQMQQQQQADIESEVTSDLYQQHSQNF